MTIYERIEALTQSVELLASRRQDLEKKWDGRMLKMTEILESLNDTTKRMSRLIEIHEQRLDDHARRIDGLENK